MNLALFGALSVALLFYFFAAFTLYIAHLAQTGAAADDVPLGSGLFAINLAIGFCALPLILLIWLAWETKYGELLSFVGTAAAGSTTVLQRRIGVVAQATLAAIFWSLLFAVLLTRSYPNFTFDGVPLLSEISTLTALLVPVALFVPLVVTAVFVCVGQVHFRRKI